MTGLEILNYYKENDLPVPDHYKIYDNDEFRKKFNK
jgi:hypothetical protein